MDAEQQSARYALDCNTFCVAYKRLRRGSDAEEEFADPPMRLSRTGLFHSCADATSHRAASANTRAAQGDLCSLVAGSDGGAAQTAGPRRAGNDAGCAATGLPFVFEKSQLGGRVDAASARRCAPDRRTHTAWPGVAGEDFAHCGRRDPRAEAQFHGAGSHHPRDERAWRERRRCNNLGSSGRHRERLFGGPRGFTRIHNR